MIGHLLAYETDQFSSFQPIAYTSFVDYGQCALLFRSGQLHPLCSLQSSATLF